MAIYHLNARGIAPARGSSAVASAAYQSGETLRDEATGELKRYARAERIADTGIVLPGGMPALDRQTIWNEAQRVYAGGNELVAKRYEFALPHELDLDGQRACVLDFCSLFNDRACDWAIHDSGDGNPHAHVLVSALAIGPDGFERPKAQKSTKVYLCRYPDGSNVMVEARDWKAAKAEGIEKVYNFKDGERRTMSQAEAQGLTKDDRKTKTPVAVTAKMDGTKAFDAEKAELTSIRAAWAGIANRHLAQAAAMTGSAPQSIDHRSNKDRYMDEQPTVHEGGAGLIGHADRVKLNEEIKARNERLRVLRAELQQEGAALEQLQREVAELERQRGRIEKAKRGRVQGRHKGALAKRRRVAMATAAAAAETQRRMATAAANQVDTRVEMIAQLDEQIADLDQEMHRLQRGGTAIMMSSNLIKATELAAERKKLADERARLASEGETRRRREPPTPEQKRRGPKR